MRNIPVDFNVKEYIELNEDLKDMTELQAKNHYEHYGYKENRKYKYDNVPHDFNTKEYIELNEDLKDMTEITAMIHYEHYGYKENRKYKYDNIPDDFNTKEYIELNKDLTNLTDLEAKNHYEYYGYAENRFYKKEDILVYNIQEVSNAKEYTELNSDNQEVYDDNYINKIISEYPYFFHKYYLNLSNNTSKIQYKIISQNTSNINEFICHLHILNINEFDNIYGKYISNLENEFKIVITYSFGNIQDNLLHNKNIDIILIPNKGYDIGAKLCMLKYLQNENIEYNYVLFLHSKSNIETRNIYFDSLIYSLHRIKLIKILLKYKNITAVFPNKIWHDKNNLAFVYNEKNYEEILEILKIKNKYKHYKLFPEGNCFACNKKLINNIFKYNYELWYNLLNDSNSFDCNWVNIKYNLNLKSPKDIHTYYFNNNCYGNNTKIKNSIESIPDGMVEHIFERLWIVSILNTNDKYLVLDKENIFKQYNIKLNALYFPQFHEIPENNNFWGKGFTEWTLLKPYNNKIILNNISYDIYKPHNDIDYYDLSNIETLNKQIKIAEEYNINGFIIYHYWFNDNTKILYKPLEHFLDEKITFPFSISWANETWSKRWDGSDREVLIKQDYGTTNESFIKHINYLIQFFKRPNYMKNSKGECIFYIYNIHDIICLEEMVNIWTIELNKENLKIDIIITENSIKPNHNFKLLNLNKFIFEPMYSTIYINRNIVYNNLDINNLTEKNFDIDYYIEKNNDLIVLNKNEAFNHYLKYGINEQRYIKVNGEEIKYNEELDYDNIIDSYKFNKYCVKNKHLGLPLHWNNCVRRKNLPCLYVKNFSLEKLTEMLLLHTSSIVDKYSNIYNLNNIINLNYDNIININAWNEWNEQAILEPNNITGYDNINTISNIINNL
jgi:hypothetical protein